jgi:hypothetical protein
MLYFEHQSDVGSLTPDRSHRRMPTFHRLKIIGRVPLQEILLDKNYRVLLK